MLGFFNSCEGCHLFSKSQVKMGEHQNLKSQHHMVNPIPLSQRKVKLHCIPLHVKNPSPVKNGVFKGTAVFMPDYSHPHRVKTPGGVKL